MSITGIARGSNNDTSAGETGYLILKGSGDLYIRIPKIGGYSSTIMWLTANY